MADNTQVAAGAGDSIRDIDRGTAKTQVVALDGGGTQGESIVDPGNPLPVIGVTDRYQTAILLQQLQLAAAAAQCSNGFVPIETLDFLGAF